MSLLERLGRGHLDDQQFARLWTIRRRRTRISTRCADCRARYDDVRRAGSSASATTLRAEADDAFPAERLTVQQAQIARRLETLERPARVIAFPKAARAVISGHSHVRRWVTVAAAASLIAGIRPRPGRPAPRRDRPAAGRPPPRRRLHRAADGDPRQGADAGPGVAPTTTSCCPTPSPARASAPERARRHDAARARLRHVEVSADAAPHLPQGPRHERGRRG